MPTTAEQIIELINVKLSEYESVQTYAYRCFLEADSDVQRGNAREALLMMASCGIVLQEILDEVAPGSVEA